MLIIIKLVITVITKTNNSIYLLIMLWITDCSVKDNGSIKMPKYIRTSGDAKDMIFIYLLSLI